MNRSDIREQKRENSRSRSRSNRSNNKTFWKKPTPRFVGRFGEVAKQTLPEFYVKKCDPVTKKSRVIPEMVYPITANGAPIPLHEIQEDTFRAYRSILHNHLALLRSSFDRSSIHRVKHAAGQPPRLINEKGETKPVPNYFSYKNSSYCPPGFFCRTYLNNVMGHPSLKGSLRKESPCSIVTIQGPFDQMYQLSQSGYKEDLDLQYFDSDVIINKSSIPQRMLVYNAPFAVSDYAMDANFKVPLTQRVQDVLKTQKQNEEDSGLPLVST